MKIQLLINEKDLINNFRSLKKATRKHRMKILVVITFAYVVISAFYIARDISYERFNMVIDEGFCSNVSGNTITIDGRTYQCMSIFSDGAKEAFENHIIRFHARYSQEYDKWLRSCVEQV